jgi:hypothetical protein
LKRAGQASQNAPLAPEPGRSSKPIRVAIAFDERLFRQIRAAELVFSGQTFEAVGGALGTTATSAKRMAFHGACYISVSASGHQHYEAAVAYCAAVDRDRALAATKSRQRAPIRRRLATGSAGTGRPDRADRSTIPHRENDLMLARPELIEGCMLWTERAKRLLDSTKLALHPWEVVVEQQSPRRDELLRRMRAVWPQLPECARSLLDRDLDIQMALQIRSIRMSEAVCKEILREIYKGQHTDLFTPVFRQLSTDGYQACG